jgi:hypothetical protein
VDLPSLGVSAAENFLVTVLASSFVSGAIFYWLTGRKERRQFLRSKLEELFTAYQGYCKIIASSLYLPFIEVMAGRPDYNQALDLLNSIPNDTPRYHDACEMIIRLYFDEFLAALDALMMRRGDLISVKSEFRRSLETGQDTRTFIKPFDAAMVEFQKREQIL